MKGIIKLKSEPKIVLGTWAWGDNNSYFGNSYDQEHFRQVYAKAMQQKLNFWDTAYAYGHGASEKILGNLMEETPREDLILSTKFTPNLANESENPVIAMFNGSLQRLKTNYIDYYWIHNNDDVEKFTPLVIPLLKSGKVKHLGVSNHNLAQIKRVQEILAQADLKLDAVQNHLSLLDRTSERNGILKYCKDNDIKFFSYMVLEQGALTGKYNVSHPFPSGSMRAKVYNPQLGQLTDLLNELKIISEKHQCSIAQIAMAWAINKGTLPIIGVTKVQQVEDAARVVKIQLTQDEMDSLESQANVTQADTVGFWEQDLR